MRKLLLVVCVPFLLIACRGDADLRQGDIGGQATPTPSTQPEEECQPPMRGRVVSPMKASRAVSAYAAVIRRRVSPANGTMQFFISLIER